MRLRTLLLSCLAGSTLALPALDRRQEGPAETAFRKVDGQMRNVVNVFRDPSLWSDPGRATNQAVASTNSLVSELHIAALDIRRGPNIGLAELMRLLSWSQDLTKILEISMGEWVGKLRPVQSTGLKDPVCGAFKGLLAGTIDFNTAIGEKMVSLAKNYGDAQFKEKQAGYIKTANDKFGCPKL